MILLSSWTFFQLFFHVNACFSFSISSSSSTTSRRSGVDAAGKENKQLVSLQPALLLLSNVRTLPMVGRMNWLHLVSTNVNEETTAEIATEKVANKNIEFISEPMRLYIEDTDAYGVKYNGNYIRSYERALFQFYQNINGNHDIDFANDLVNDEHFTLRKVTQHKFKSSPKLGAAYCIHGTLLKTCRETREEVWSLEMIKQWDDEDNQNEEEERKEPIVYNTAVVTIVPTKHTEGLMVYSPKAEYHDVTPTFQDEFTIHRDEFDIHLSNSIPIQTVLNLFERQRTNGLGGPDVLQKMQDEHNILWVVTSIDDLQIFHDTSEDLLKPGVKAIVRSYVDVKRRGMILDFHQQVVVKDKGDRESTEVESEFVVAEGRVTICAIDSEKKRPTSKIPTYVQELFEKRG
ncbi:hypothetical protein CTEN210_13327 [Chaetoceros tenuissimus]|uniref:Uncharacterized protein n=1 Tax=Chaetoceros tenuissimus TaxID=426638 RepID=A0AAD3HB45_9STRA|nr:hypothetical protein CTEN210_13327 [Chaetoceros tenuissimus]